MTVAASEQHGAAAIELALAIAVLLFPVVVLAASIPTWVDQRDAAADAAREGARVAALDFPDDSGRRARTAALAAAQSHGVPPTRVEVDIEPAAARGGTARAHVTVRIAALHLPGVGSTGSWSVSVTAARRVDDYRSR